MQQIIVVHGAIGSAQQMQPVTSALRAFGDVCVVELPGHGYTPLGGCTFSMETFVSALADAVDALSYPASGSANQSARPVVFGYSMGGYIALALESQRPGTFGAIATLGTKFLWTPEVALHAVSRLDPKLIQEKLPAYAAALQDRHADCGGWHEVLANTATLLRWLGGNPALNSDSLARVRIPVCIAVGDRDDSVDASEAALVASWMENATSVVIDGTPHPIERVDTAHVVSLVTSIMRGPATNLQ